jgi:cytidine deaminase
MAAIDWDELRAAARAASERAYAPYSKFRVGAAGLTDDGRIVTGCNVENASYGLALCAECGLISALHQSGGGTLVAVAIVSGSGEPCTPCGRCRQLLFEHGGPDCLVEGDTEIRTVSELLPFGFEPSRLEEG